jgi:SAM-dependent methyltransferase
MPDVWATIAEADPATQHILGNVLGLLESTPDMQASLEAFVSGVEYPPNARVLEIGSGTGRVARVIAMQPGVGHVTGVDPSPVLTEKARALSASFSNVSYDLMDGRKLTFESGQFDVVFIVRTLLHVPGPEQVLVEAHRVLRPGGTLALLDGDGDTTTVALGAHDPLQDCVEAWKSAYLNDAWIVRRLPALLRAAGFEILSTRNHGVVQTSRANVMLTGIDRGADVMVSNGIIGPELGAALKKEARDRLETGRFYGLLGETAFIARRSA